MRLTIFFAALLIIVAAGFLAVLGGMSSRVLSPTLMTPNKTTISLLIADTSEERERGLGGRAFLQRHEGMLFVFPESGRYGIWMKGMLFPLDVVWLEETTPSQSPPLKRGRGKKTLRVVDMKEDVATGTYPALFTPRDKARYVLEVNAGVAHETGLRIGEGLEFAR